MHWLENACDLLADAFAENYRGKQTMYGAYMAANGCEGLNDCNHLKEMKGPHHWDARPSDVPLEHCIESCITKTATTFIEGLNRDEPFAMQLSYPRPHHALTPDQKFPIHRAERQSPAQRLNTLPGLLFEQDLLMK